MKNMYTEQRQQKQLLEDIKKAENVFVWVGVYEGDGEYLPTTKKVLRELIINSIEKSRTATDQTIINYLLKKQFHLGKDHSWLDLDLYYKKQEGQENK